MAGIDTGRNGLVDRFGKVGYARPGFITHRPDFITNFLHRYNRCIYQGRYLSQTVREIAVQLEAGSRNSQNRSGQQGELI